MNPLSSMFLTKPAIIATVILAETGASLIPAELAPLANLGAMGCVLLWFMMRSEPRMMKLVESNERVTKMMGFAIMAVEMLDPAVKRQVKQLIDEVEAEELKRKK